MRVELEIESPAGRKAVAPKGPVIRIGRDPDCEVRFDDARFPKVSGLHAQLEQAPDGVAARHLSRSNATLLNGAPIEGSVTLKRGDVLQLGYTGPAIRLVDYWLPFGSAGKKPADEAPPVEPSPAPPLELKERKAPPALWFGVGGILVISALVLTYLVTLKPPSDRDPPSKTDLVAATDAPKPAPAPVKPTPPTSSPSDDDRLRNAVVSVGMEVDGVFRIQGSGLLVTPELVVTTADLVRFITQSIKATTADKKAFQGKDVFPAVRHAGGMVRLRRLAADPKYDPDRPGPTLGRNLAVGVLDRSLIELAAWPSLKTAAAALVAPPSENPGAVDVFAWDGKGTDAFAFQRRDWPAVAIQGADAGPSGEFVAFHLSQDFPGSAAGGPVFKEGRWRGLLLRHPSPSDPNKKTWKFVTLEYVAPLLLLEGK